MSLKKCLGVPINISTEKILETIQVEKYIERINNAENNCDKLK